jgi:hypothetical protein
VPITDYIVQRSYNKGRTWVSLNDGVSTGRTYTATGLTNGATYQFRVRARNKIGWGPYSNIVTASPRATVPSAPRALTATVGNGVGSGRVRLTWTAPAETGGVPITDYIVQRSSNRGRTWDSLNDGVSTGRTYTATGLTDGATYQFRVRARNEKGWGQASNIVTATPAAPLSATPLTAVSAAATVPTTSTTTASSTVPPIVPAPNSSGSPTTSVGTEVSSIGDLVWLDGSGDGLQQPEEPGIEGVVVVLRDAAGLELARDVTDHLGNYEFTDLRAGSFVLEVELPDGYGITRVDQGPNDELDSDLMTLDEQNGTARTDQVAVPADRPDGFDLGLIELQVTEPSTTAAPEVTTTQPPPSSAAATTTSVAAPTSVPPTEPPTTAAPEVTTTQPPPSSAAATTTSVAAPTSVPPTEPPTTAPVSTVVPSTEAPTTVPATTAPPTTVAPATSAAPTATG